MEESAAFRLKTGVILYPGVLKNPFEWIVNHYSKDTKVTILPYSVKPLKKLEQSPESPPKTTQTVSVGLKNREFSLISLSLAKMFDDFDQLNISWFAVDNQGRVLRWNQVLSDIVDSIFPGIDKTHLHVSEIDENAWKNLLSIMETKKTEVIEEKAPNNKWYLSIKSPLITHSQVKGVIGIAIDITAKKQAEIAKNRFLENMEHDIRTPFSGIYSMVEYARDQTHEIETKELLGYVLEGARALLNLMNQVLDVTKSGNYPVVKSGFELQELISEISQLVMPSIQTKHLELRVNCAKQLVYSDRFRIHRILLNLVSNAIKFTENGYIAINVITEPTLQIQVQDTGCGIPKEELENIFEQFTKLTPSNKAGDFKGAGVGLYLSRCMANDINATLTVSHSVVGKGSTFTLTL